MLEKKYIYTYLNTNNSINIFILVQIIIYSNMNINKNILNRFYSAVGPRSKEENSAFLLKVKLTSSPASAGSSPRAKLIFRSTNWIKDSAS